MYCSHYEDNNWGTSTNSKSKLSADNPQNRQFIATAEDFVSRNMTKILSKEYFSNSEYSPLFEYLHHFSEIEGKTYLTLYLYEKPSEQSKIAEVAQRGYTNVVFEIDTKKNALFFPYLIKILSGRRVFSF